MEIRKIILLYVLALSVTSWSQNISFEGVVLDSIGVAIPTANIVATNQVTNRMDNFAISNLDGL